MVEFSKEDAVFLAVAVLAQAYITPQLPELPDGGLTSLLNDPTTQSLLIIGVIFLILHSGWQYGRELLSIEDDSGGSVGVEVFTGPPSKTLYVAVIRYAGVDWEGQFGTSRGSEITYVEGPYCPRCETELSMKTENRRIRSDQKLWKCPSCSFSTSRETDTRDSQRDMVEKIVENEADDAIRNTLAQDDSEIKKTIEDILENAIRRESTVEDFVENQGSETHSDEVREAIVAAIAEEVQENEIRRNPTLRVVLRKEFDYSLPDDNRKYEVIDEQVNESEIRRRNRW
jgi:transposase-like protein